MQSSERWGVGGIRVWGRGEAGSSVATALWSAAPSALSSPSPPLALFQRVPCNHLLPTASLRVRFKEPDLKQDLWLSLHAFHPYLAKEPYAIQAHTWKAPWSTSRVAVSSYLPFLEQKSISSIFFTFYPLVSLKYGYSAFSEASVK